MFGDDNSPLYPPKEAFGHRRGRYPDQPDVLGVLSVVFRAMVLVRDKRFPVMSRNATPATKVFPAPGHRRVELGMQVTI